MRAIWLATCKLHSQTINPIDQRALEVDDSQSERLTRWYNTFLGAEFFLSYENQEQ